MVECHTRAISPLVHAAHAPVFDNEILRDAINERVELDDEMTATTTAGTGGKIRERGQTYLLVWKPGRRRRTRNGSWVMYRRKPRPNSEIGRGQDETCNA